MKKLISASLVFSLFICLMLPAYASPVSDLSVRDPYASGYSETLSIDNKSYTFTYGLTSAGERTVSDESGHTDIIRADITATTFYLNDSFIASIHEIAIPSKNINGVLSTNDGWSNPVYHSDYVSWARGATVFVVATAIGIKLGGTVGAVIGACGSFYAMCIGGTLDWYTQYNIDNGFDPKLRTTWTFTSGNDDVYGPYSFTITR